MNYRPHATFLVSDTPVIMGIHMQTPIQGVVTHAAGRLKYPKLLALTATIFVVDLFVPDLVPFVDEILLGLGTLLLSRLRIRRADASSTP